MSLSKEEIWQRVGQIAIAYPLLECDKCAITIMQWLKSQEIEGVVLRLRPKRRSEMFITSDRHGSGESITENGKHYGVEVMGKVFDNLSSVGLSKEAWLSDFHCASGRFTIEKVSLSLLEDEVL